MGCDIHMHTERRVDGRWVHVEQGPYDDRNYGFFSALANVRSYDDYGGPIAEGRGIPEDASPEVQADSEVWGSDGHSRSYATLDELECFLAENPEPKDGASFWTDGMTKLRAIGGDPEHVRIVFWFDN